MNKNNVLYKMKISSGKDNYRYFQPVITNNTKVIAAKVTDIEKSINIDRTMYYKENKEYQNKEEKNVYTFKLDLAKDLTDDKANSSIERIREEIKKELEDFEFEFEQENEELVEQFKSEDINVDEKDEFEEENEELDIESSDNQETNNLSDFKVKLFLLASNAVKPVKIMVNRKIFLIGSDLEKMDCVIRNNRYISKCHAKIYYMPDNYYIEDAGSMNGTYINGVRLAKGLKYKLMAGDVINLADCKFEVTMK